MADPRYEELEDLTTVAEFVVEASSYEKQSLWERWAKQSPSPTKPLVDWHQAGREGAEWFEAAEKLGAALDSLLELRSNPATTPSPKTAVGGEAQRFVTAAFAYLDTIAGGDICNDRTCIRCRIADAALEVQRSSSGVSK